MATTPTPSDRPSRPRWVYGLGLTILLVTVAAVFAAVSFYSEGNVDPADSEPPIVNPQTAPTDGEK